MSEPLWKFEGYETPSEKRLVQLWFWDDISLEDRDAIRDRVAYLENVKKPLWHEPRFKSLGDNLGEIKARSNIGTIRVYGKFFDERDAFVLLEGVNKKSTKDNRGFDAARDRAKRLKQGIGGTHGFDFEDRPNEKDGSGQVDAGKAGGLSLVPRRGVSN